MLSEKLTGLDGIGEDIRDASGEAGSILKAIRDFINQIIEFFKKIGVKGIFVGHEHTNSSSVLYKGVRLTVSHRST